MEKTGQKLIKVIRQMDLADDGLFILVIISFVLLVAILFYNDIKKDLKYRMNKEAMTCSDIVNKLVAFLGEYDSYPRIEIVAFSTFARIFYPKHYDVRGQDTYSFFLDRCQDLRYFERSKFPLNDVEIDILILALSEELRDKYPQAKIDYDKYTLTVVFYEQKTGFVMR